MDSRWQYRAKKLTNSLEAKKLKYGYTGTGKPFDPFKKNAELLEGAKHDKDGTTEQTAIVRYEEEEKNITSQADKNLRKEKYKITSTEKVIESKKEQENLRLFTARYLAFTQYHSTLAGSGIKYKESAGMAVTRILEAKDRISKINDAINTKRGELTNIDMDSGNIRGIKRKRDAIKADIIRNKGKIIELQGKIYCWEIWRDLTKGRREWRAIQGETAEKGCDKMDNWLVEHNGWSTKDKQRIRDMQTYMDSLHHAISRAKNVEDLEKLYRGAKEQQEASDAGSQGQKEAQPIQSFRSDYSRGVAIVNASWANYTKQRILFAQIQQKEGEYNALSQEHTKLEDEHRLAEGNSSKGKGKSKESEDVANGENNELKQELNSEIRNEFILKIRAKMKSTRKDVFDLSNKLKKLEEYDQKTYDAFKEIKGRFQDLEETRGEASNPSESEKNTTKDWLKSIPKHLSSLITWPRLSMHNRSSNSDGTIQRVASDARNYMNRQWKNRHKAKGSPGNQRDVTPPVSTSRRTHSIPYQETVRTVNDEEGQSARDLDRTNTADRATRGGTREREDLTTGSNLSQFTERLGDLEEQSVQPTSTMEQLVLSPDGGEGPSNPSAGGDQNASTPAERRATKADFKQWSAAIGTNPIFHRSETFSDDKAVLDAEIESSSSSKASSVKEFTPLSPPPPREK